MEDLSGNWCVYLKVFPTNTELRGRPAVSTHCFHTECQPNDGENYPQWCWGWITEQPKQSQVGNLEKNIFKEHILLRIVSQKCLPTSVFNTVLYIWELICGNFNDVKLVWIFLIFFLAWYHISTILIVNNPCSKQVSAGLFPFFVSALFLETLVCLPGFRPDEAARPSQASLGSHRIPCPITGHRGLKRGRITLSQQTTGNRKTESAASRRSSQPSTVSHGLIGLHLHLLHQNRSFRFGLACPGFGCR